MLILDSVIFSKCVDFCLFVCFSWHFIGLDLNHKLCFFNGRVYTWNLDLLLSLLATLRQFPVSVIAQSSFVVALFSGSSGQNGFGFLSGS